MANPETNMISAETAEDLIDRAKQHRVKCHPLSLYEHGYWKGYITALEHVKSPGFAKLLKSVRQDD